MLALANATAGGASPAAQSTTLRLDPAELGRLDIRIDQASSGATSVSLTVEKPATLELLVRDQAQLHQALDQAGVPSLGRAVTFHLATAQQGGAALTDALQAVNLPSASHLGPAQHSGLAAATYPGASDGRAAGSAFTAGGQSGSAPGNGPGGEAASSDSQRQQGGRSRSPWSAAAGPAPGASASGFTSSGRVAGIDITA